MNKAETYSILKKLQQYSGTRSSGIIEQAIFPNSTLQMYLGILFPYNYLFLRIKIPNDSRYSIGNIAFKNLIISYNEKNNSIIFSLANNAYLDIFSTMIAEIYVMTEELSNFSGDEQFLRIIDFIEHWRAFFQPIKSFSKEKILGLLCELLFFKHLLSLGFSADRVLDSWNGPHHTSQDYNFENIFFEIKHVNNDLLKISSKYQLFSDTNDTIYLVTYISDSSAPKYSLNSLIAEISKTIQIDELILQFKEKIQRYGFDEVKHGEKEGNYMYSLILDNIYIVNNEFPRITPTNTNPKIHDVKYTIFINQLTNFIIDEKISVLIPPYQNSD